MKRSATLATVVLIALATLGGCKKSSDPAPATNTTVVMPAVNYTAYTGAYSYVDATGKVVADDKAKATVTDKGSNTVEIRFSPSGSPTVTFTVQKNTNGDYANIDYSQVKGISFRDKSLDVGLTSTNPVYTLSFAGTR